MPKLLPRKKSRRGYVRALKSKVLIPDRVPIAQRPEDVNKRNELGHLEGDLIFNKGSLSNNILTIIDRKSRVVVLVKNNTKKTCPIVESASKIAQQLGAKTMTFDNGMEFAGHKKLTELHGIKTYFCRPGAPWEKGSVENMNKMIRRFLPFKLAANIITQELIDYVAEILNNIPRKILGFKTPLEAHGLFDLTTKLKGDRMKLPSPGTEALVKTDYEKILSDVLHY